MTKVIGKLKYDPKDKIGQGSFGTVFSGFYARQTGLGAIGIVFGVFPSDSTPVAVKQIEMSRVKEDDVKNEVKLIEMAHNHRNILKYLHFEKDTNFMYIATELCRGTLQQYITGKGYKGPKFQCEREILSQITLGLDHLHKLKIVHRDLNPNNILIHVQILPEVKLADFGCCKVIERDFTNSSVTNPTGTRGWIAPELYQNKRAGPEVDIFALGLIFGYTLSGGKHPFGDDPDKRSVRIKDEQSMLMIRNDLKEPYSSENDEAFDLIQSMLVMNPEKRPTAEDIVNSLFFLVVMIPDERPSVEEITNNFFSCQANRQKIFESVCNAFKGGPYAYSICYFKELLIDEDPININCILHYGDSLLNILCRYYEGDNLVYLVQLLVKKGADVKKENIFGWNPLHYVCYFYEKDNLIDIVQLLIENGADVNAKNHLRLTPLHVLCIFNEYAIKGGDNLKSLVSLFEKNGASMDANGNREMTPNDYLIKRKNGKKLFKHLNPLPLE